MNRQSESTSMQEARRLVGALARMLRADGIVETHISWVLLAATEAFKLKKPLHLQFLDYATPDARKHFCEEEVRVNRRLAPDLYLGVKTIGGTAQAPVLDGDPAIDYAVHMRRFDEKDVFATRLAAGRLEAADVDALADLLARFHADACEAHRGDGAGTPELRADLALAALSGAKNAGSLAEAQALHAWMEERAHRLHVFWDARRDQGRVRECHGDLHLDNILRTSQGVAAFDAIEFDTRLRWIDVIDDVAFPVMDLEARGRADFAWRLLNRWLDGTGDHDGLPALGFSMVYRALVRAQVALLRRERAAARRYWQEALHRIAPCRPRLTITHGLPGSGKTFASQNLLEREGAIRLRSDVERKRIFGLAPLADSRAAGIAIYTKEAGARTYDQLFGRAELALRAGYPVVIDAAFLRRAQRTRARALADRLHIPFAILACDSPHEVLRERLLARRGDASEADPQVLELAIREREPLGPDELSSVKPSVAPEQEAARGVS